MARYRPRWEAASRDLVRDIGKRLRWLREAYEQREPLHHGQAQWAQAFGISPPSLSRYEAGLISPPAYVLSDIALQSDASMDYLFFGVLSADMPPWLRQSLLTAHPGELLLPETFESLRLPAILLWGGPRGRRLRKAARARRG